MTLEEFAVLSSLNRFRTLTRPGLSFAAGAAYTATTEERLWLAAIDSCLAKKWIDLDTTDRTHTLTPRGLANLKAALQDLQNLVASVGWLG